MADNSRIEDLRKRYHENPRRFFAPLANEYRKSGFLDRALLLCQKHVPEQPENMNGLVVYGQTLFEMGEHEAAREPFEQALKLDPENLIALRHLGDIARLQDDIPTAKAWYGKVLELDRRNDEVLDLLGQLGGDEAAAAPEPPSARPSIASNLISVAPTVSVSGPDVGLVDLGESAAPPAATPPIAEAPSAPAPATVEVPAQTPPARVSEAAPPPRPSKRASLLDISFDFGESGEVETPKPVPQAPLLGAEAAEYGFADINLSEPPAPLASPEPEPEESTFALPNVGDDSLIIEASGDVSPLAGLETSEFTSGEAAPMSELEPDSFSMELPSVAPLDGLDRPDLTVDEVAPVAGFDGLADLPLLDVPAEEAEPAKELPPIEETPSARPRPRMTKADLAELPLLADFGLEDDSVDEPSAPPAEPEPRASKATPTFVTETMAALYVQQGLFPEAIGVYRQLVDASPDDESLRAKLAELERMHSQQATPAAPAAEEMPEFEAPEAFSEPEPAPANAAMESVSFGSIDLQGQGSATPVITPAVAGGPTAREFFGNFARRAAVVAAASAVIAAPITDASAEQPTVAPPSAATGWPLDALFGAASDVRDLHAAETLSGISSFEGPNGGTGIGELLAGDSAPRRSVPRASETLKFDQFFQQPGTATPPSTEIAPAEPGDDDLDQFQDWLKGLKP